jgi:hypothetical protein
MGVTYVSPETARAERLRRETARLDLNAYTNYVYPWFKNAAHHRLVNEKLMQVIRYIETGGKEGIGFLMLNLPPRHGKTTQVSRVTPSFLLGRNPDSRVILASYGADLAQDDSRAVRDIVTGERFNALFGQKSRFEAPVMLSDDSRSIGNWNLADPHRGGVVAAGVGGGITGKGADLLVVDDPFKNREEAESEAYRKRVISWWQSSAYTRLEPSGAVIITHTRWHQQDLAGELLMEMASDPLAPQWEVLFLPALALEPDNYPKNADEFRENLLKGIFIPYADPMGREANHPLWPERYDGPRLERILHTSGEYEFTSLYQQLPRPASGGMFEEEDFKLIEKAPEGLTWYAYVDLALGESARSDLNVTGDVALDDKGNLYIRDVMEVRDLTNFLSALAGRMVREDKKGVVYGFEWVSFQALVLKDFRKKKELVNVAMYPVKPIGSKEDRARAWHSRAKGKQVYLVRGEWTMSFIHQVVSFPQGKHDDQVDMVSGGVQMIAQHVGGVKQKATCHEG